MGTLTHPDFLRSFGTPSCDSWYSRFCVERRRGPPEYSPTHQLTLKRGMTSNLMGKPKIPNSPEHQKPLPKNIKKGDTKHTGSCDDLIADGMIAIYPFDSFCT